MLLGWESRHVKTYFRDKVFDYLGVKTRYLLQQFQHIVILDKYVLDTLGQFVNETLRLSYTLTNHLKHIYMVLLDKACASLQQLLRTGRQFLVINTFDVFYCQLTTLAKHIYQSGCSNT